MINRNKGQRSGFPAKFAQNQSTLQHEGVFEHLYLCNVCCSYRPRVLETRWVPYMGDLLNLVMLICAAVGSMAFGVLSAYGIFRVAFAMMRPRRKPVPVKAQAEAATIL